MSDLAELLIARARDEGAALTGNGGLLTGLVRQVLQTRLDGLSGEVISLYAKGLTTVRSKRIWPRPRPPR